MTTDPKSGEGYDKDLPVTNRGAGKRATRVKNQTRTRIHIGLYEPEENARRVLSYLCSLMSHCTVEQQPEPHVIQGFLDLYTLLAQHSSSGTEDRLTALQEQIDDLYTQQELRKSG